jgi:hypothetical protein
MNTKHRTKTKKQTAIQTTETMSNTDLIKYYEADEWLKMTVKGKYFLRERGCLRIFHLFKFYCSMGSFVFVGAVSCDN